MFFRRQAFTTNTAGTGLWTLTSGASKCLHENAVHETASLCTVGDVQRSSGSESLELCVAVLVRRHVPRQVVALAEVLAAHGAPELLLALLAHRVRAGVAPVLRAHVVNEIGSHAEAEIAFGAHVLRRGRGETGRERRGRQLHLRRLRRGGRRRRRRYRRGHARRVGSRQAVIERRIEGRERRRILAHRRFARAERAEILARVVQLLLVIERRPDVILDEIIRAIWATRRSRRGLGLREQALLLGHRRRGHRGIAEQRRHGQSLRVLLQQLERQCRRYRGERERVVIRRRHHAQIDRAAQAARRRRRVRALAHFLEGASR